MMQEACLRARVEIARGSVGGQAARRSSLRKTFIVLRQSPDWRTQTYADLEGTRAFCRMIHRREDLIIDVVKLWDRTFSIPFFAARQAMKELSLENLRSIGHAVVLPLSDVRGALEPDAFYLFVDDDDWYDPEIALHLQLFDPRRCAAVLWRQATVTDELLFSDEWTFFSNNYAVSGDYLLRKKKNLNKVVQHFEAEGTFHCPRLKHRIRRIGYSTYARQLFVPGYRTVVRTEAHWGVKNEHPAATMSLERLGDHATPDDLRAMVRQTVDAARRGIIPQHLAWARPLYERTGEFFAQL